MRAVYKDAYDTDLPSTHPWEMLGSINPTWWETVYGSHPILAKTKFLERFRARKNCRVLQTVQYVAITNVQDLLHIFVDDGGNLLSPLDSNYAKQFTSINTNASFRFGDSIPTETAWRRSPMNIL